MAIRLEAKPNVVHGPKLVVHAEPDAVVHKGKRGEARYRDPEARKEYRREWMRRKRGV